MTTTAPNPAPQLIAIDGTFASGKGTLGKRLAAHYGLAYMDTGKLYRATAKAVLDANGDPHNSQQAEAAAQSLSQTDLSQTLNDPILKSGVIGEAASKVAVHPEVRKALFDLQRHFAAKGAVLDGRDIGTVICPDADVKLYVDAKAEIRAQRRYEELAGYGEDITFETVLAQLKERDERDMNRDNAPLKPADDAHFLDSSYLSIDKAFDAACAIITAVMSAKT
jgi:cytidylate kinase